VDYMVSIITPTYNSEIYIEETIKSVLAQSYQNWEMLIVDDCSTDGTANVVKEYCAREPRIKLISLPENQGVAAARNEAIKRAKGQYLAFLDSDDLWLPEKLTTHLEFMQKHKCLISYTAYQLMNESGTVRDKIIRVPYKLQYKDLLHRGNPLGCLTVIINRDVGEFHMPAILGEDYATWIEILKRGYTAYGLDKPLSVYRRRKNSLSSNKMLILKRLWGIFYHYHKISFPHAIYCVCSYLFYTFKKYYF
jgi:teichuronic acid biosynthesis glycosyltransferase TuaG